jgi:hypothetical protein
MTVTMWKVNSIKGIIVRSVDLIRDVRFASSVVSEILIRQTLPSSNLGPLVI